MTDKKRILVIEDEPDLVQMMKIRLEANGYEVLTAYDGVEGLERALKEHPDLIILDLMLPKMDGYKVLSLLKQDAQLGKVPIALFTARAQEEDIKRGLQAGADAYIRKPFQAEELLGTIRSLLSK